MRKQISSLLVLTVLSLTSAFAQSEGLENDSLPVISLDGSRHISLDGSQKTFDGGFILDMGSMLATPEFSAPALLPQQLDWQSLLTLSGVAKDYNSIFRPKGNVTYGRSSFSPTQSGFYGWGANPHSPTLQSATYRLNNGLRITTYGEYNADGHKVHNPAALPWQRNNFNAGFEFKSESGNFSIGIGVQAGRR